MGIIGNDGLLQCPRCGMLFYVHEYHQCPTREGEIRNEDAYFEYADITIQTRTEF
ncbi:hypothetical protein [Methanohalophilus sp.]